MKQQEHLSLLVVQKSTERIGQVHLLWKTCVVLRVHPFLVSGSKSILSKEQVKKKFSQRKSDTTQGTWSFENHVQVELLRSEKDHHHFAIAPFLAIDIKAPNPWRAELALAQVMTYIRVNGLRLRRQKGHYRQASIAAVLETLMFREERENQILDVPRFVLDIPASVQLSQQLRSSFCRILLACSCIPKVLIELIEQYLFASGKSVTVLVPDSAVFTSQCSYLVLDAEVRFYDQRGAISIHYSTVTAEYHCSKSVPLHQEVCYGFQRPVVVLHRESDTR